MKTIYLLATILLANIGFTRPNSRANTNKIDDTVGKPGGKPL